MNSPALQSHFIKAVYRQEVLDEYRGNPLIEALPAIRTEDEWVQQLGILPQFDAGQRELPGHVRSQLVMRLKNFFLPLTRNITLAERVDTVLRSGYVNRNPNNNQRVSSLQQLYEASQNNQGRPIHFGEHLPNSSISLMGFSGMGKSTTVEHCLLSYPQVLLHEESGLHQLVWLKVNVPHDGSIKQLVLDLIGQIDRLLGTTFRKKLSSRAGADELLDQVKHLVLVYQLGLLVVDEIQNLSVKKSGGRESMLNFFQELCNQLGVPVMLMGTMKATNILQMDFRHARRNTGMGSFDWQNLENDEEWSCLVECLWEYQWVKQPMPLNEEIIGILHRETQGIPALLCAGFMVSQIRAISTGEECVTPELFIDVMQKDFKPVQPMLNALKSGDPRRIRHYEDIVPLNLDEMLQREQYAPSKAKNTPAKSNRSEHPEVTKAADTLQLMGYDRAMVVQHLLELRQKLGDRKAPTLVKRFLEQMHENSPNDDDLGEDDPQDLRK